MQRRREDLRESREWLDRVAQHLDRYVRTNRQRCLLQPFTSLWPQSVRARETFAVGEQREESIAPGVVVGVCRGLRDGLQGCRAAEATFSRAHGRRLRVGEDDTRNGFVIRSATIAENVRRNDLTLILPNMRQLPDA